MSTRWAIIFTVVITSFNKRAVFSETINCTFAEPCNDTTLVCSGHDDCTVNCDYRDACRDSIINCGNHPNQTARCTVNCRDEWSCSETSIHADSAKSLTVNCGRTTVVDAHSCDCTTIHCPTASNGPNTCDVSCLNFHACHNALGYAMAPNTLFQCVDDNGGDCAEINMSTVAPTTAYPSANPTKYPTSAPALPTGVAGFVSEYIVYVVMAIILAGALLIMLFALKYALNNRPGSDWPNFRAIFIYITSVSDFYTDIIFMKLLHESKQTSVLVVIIGIVSLSLSHLLSIGTGFFYIQKWKTKFDTLEYAHIASYVSIYDKFLIALMLPCGFYPCLELCSSHLFHRQVFSLQIPITLKKRLRTIRTVNEVVLENMPLLVIQVMTLTSASAEDSNTSSNGDVFLSQITFISMTLSVISIVVGCLTFFSRLMEHCYTKRMNTQQLVRFSMTITSPKIKYKHMYSHSILRAFVLCPLLDLQSNQIEILYISKIVNGIRVRFVLKLRTQNVQQFLSDNQHIFMMRSKSSNMNNSSPYSKLRDTIIQSLHLGIHTHTEILEIGFCEERKNTFNKVTDIELAGAAAAANDGDGGTVLDGLETVTRFQ